MKINNFFEFFDIREREELNLHQEEKKLEKVMVSIIGSENKTKILKGIKESNPDLCKKLISIGKKLGMNQEDDFDVMDNLGELGF